MSGWKGTARTNYVRIDDVDGLEKSLAPFEGLIEESARLGTDDLCFIATTDDGGWPGWVKDEEGFDVEFDLAVHVCPFMADDQILVMMEAGGEKTRSITGSAIAYRKNGEKVSLFLDDIYDKAAEAFGVQKSSIPQCAY